MSYEEMAESLEEALEKLAIVEAKDEHDYCQLVRIRKLISDVHKELCDEIDTWGF